MRKKSHVENFLVKIFRQKLYWWRLGLDSHSRSGSSCGAPCKKFLLNFCYFLLVLPCSLTLGEGQCTVYLATLSNLAIVRVANPTLKFSDLS